MDITALVGNVVDFATDKIDRVIKYWDGLEDDKKKLLIGCAVAAVSIIVVASIAYGLGKACGKKVALEDDEF
jgi:hypothetical protein